MRKLMVTLLAICFGILLPTAAMPVRVCLLHPAEQAEDCCGTSTSLENCCVDLGTLASAPLPGRILETPLFVGCAIPFLVAELPDIPEAIAPSPCFAQPRTGIGPPTARLAVLNVWRL